MRGALTPTPVTTIRPDDAGAEPVQVILQLDPEAVDSVEALGRLPVGPGVTLADVATIDEQNVRATVSRVGGTASSTVSGEVIGEDTGAISAAVQAELDRLEESTGSCPRAYRSRSVASASSRRRHSAASSSRWAWRWRSST